MKQFVPNPERGFSFGLAYPYLYRLEVVFYVVYHRVTGRIVHRFSGHREYLATQACQRLNELAHPERSILEAMDVQS